MALTKSQVTSIIQRYRASDTNVETSYATVRDFCDSADHLPQITGLDGDLKNVQRPWAVKTLLRCIPPPARLLEIGGGAPVVSDFLNQLGYTVTLVDPYDGSGHGPTEYETYRNAFPDVRIVRSYFQPTTSELQAEQFDGIFSISVLEHLESNLLTSCFDAISRFLVPGGVSLHCFDFILQGIGDSYDRENGQRILDAQARLSDAGAADLPQVIAQLSADLETFYLSAQGHHLWRGGRAYDAFPFRKVVSVQTVVRNSK